MQRLVQIFYVAIESRTEKQVPTKLKVRVIADLGRKGFRCYFKTPNKTRVSGKHKIYSLSPNTIPDQLLALRLSSQALCRRK